MALTEVHTCLTLNDPAYTSTARRGFAGHSFAPSVLSALSPNSAVRLLKRFTPSATKSWHAKMADLHAEQSRKHRLNWSLVADRAAMRTFGRKFEVYDYRISAIGRDEFVDEDKDALRVHAISDGQHYRLAILHHMAAGHRHQTALAYCRQIARPSQVVH